MRHKYSSSVKAGFITASSTDCSGQDLPLVPDDAAETESAETAIGWKSELKRDEAQHIVYALASVPVAGAASALQSALWPLAGTALLPAFRLGRIRRG